MSAQRRAVLIDDCLNEHAVPVPEGVTLLWWGTELYEWIGEAHYRQVPWGPLHSGARFQSDGDALWELVGEGEAARLCARRCHVVTDTR